MAFIKYEGLRSPDEVLAKIAEYVKSKGYTVITDVTDDLNIYDMSTTDGKKFVFMDRTNTYYIMMRSANGTNIFGSDDATMDATATSTGADCDDAYYGIGMTASEGYSKTQRWYNQYLAPNTLKGTYINGVWIPINKRKKEDDTPQSFDFNGKGSSFGQYIDSKGGILGVQVKDFSSKFKDAEYYFKIVGVPDNPTSGMVNDLDKVKLVWKKGIDGIENQVIWRKNTVANEWLSDFPIDDTGLILYCSAIDTTSPVFPYFTVTGNWLKLVTKAEKKQVTPAIALSLPYTLYCNNITAPSDTLIFTVVAENTNGDVIIGHDYKAVSLVVGNIYKYDMWNGGLFFSGSSVPSLMKQAAKLFELLDSGTASQDEITAEHFKTHDEGILPILSSGNISNTFLRIDIDDAIKPVRGNIRWASSGTDNITGKPMALSIRTGEGMNGKIPHYRYLQSSDRLDWGRDINTLNCITINMPIFLSVQVDPDVLHNYSPAGQVAGVYFVSSLNMQTSGVYEMSYPRSSDLCQIFPMSSRRGKYGFDAISIRQNEDEDTDTYDSTNNNNISTMTSANTEG